MVVEFIELRKEVLQLLYRAVIELELRTHKREVWRVRTIITRGTTLYSTLSTLLSTMYVPNK